MKQMQRSLFEAIGTHWVIDVFTDKSQESIQKVFSSVKQRIEQFDQIYSRFREDSLISQIAKRSGSYQLPADADAMMRLYHQLYQITEGRFTPLIGSLLVEAGYDAEYSLQGKKLHAVPAWEQVLTYEHLRLTVKQPVLLDFGALGKGYLVDLIGSLLEQEEINSYCIDAGGDILYKTCENTPLRVGLEHPKNLEQVIGVAKIMNQSICASSGNRRKWETFHHLMDPFTFTSPKSILATWVIAKAAMLADSLATCLFFVTPDILQKYFVFEYVILYPDYTLRKSSQFSGEIYYGEKE